MTRIRNHVVRKYLALGRHAPAPQIPGGQGSYDQLMPGAVQDPFNQGKELAAELEEWGIQDPHTSLIARSPKVRTLLTAQGYMVGALDLQPKEKAVPHPPQDQEHLANYPGLNDISVLLVPDMIYHNPCWNEDVYAADPTAYTCLKYWLDHPADTTHNGKTIESANSLMARTRNICQDLLSTLIFSNYRLIVPVTHAGVADPIFWNMINSARQTPITDPNDAGGPFKMGEFAVLTIDYEPKTNKFNAAFSRKGETYPVNIEGFLG